MVELKICIFRKEDGTKQSWVDFRGLHSTCEEFERYILDSFDGLSSVCVFSIGVQDMDPGHEQLFFAFAATEKALADSDTPLADNLPTHLLESIIDKILERVH